MPKFRLKPLNAKRIFSASRLWLPANRQTSLKKWLKAALCVLLAILLIVGGYVAYVFIDYHRIGDMALTPSDGGAAAVRTDTPYTVLSYNIGFGAYEDDYGFFMDGGTESRAWSEERLTKNLSEISAFLTEQSPDFLLAQEVDIGSTRSYQVDERPYLTEALEDMSGVFCQNYDISNGSVGKMYDAEGIAELMLRLQG